MSGKLFVVGTPIGNLGDMSPRGLEALRSADFIAAEDTRVTLKLLNHFEIKKPLLSYFEHNKALSGEKIISRILAGESCAIVTDAGMPAISDPGEALVRECAESGIECVVVPGPTAMASALALSGLSTARFTFEGFLPVVTKERRERLEELTGEKRTMVFYEAPHKLRKTLSDLIEVFGAERKIALCRELTKMHEEVIRTTLGAASERYAESEPKGEFVLVVEGKPESDAPEMSVEDAVARVLRLREGGMPLKAAAKEVAADTGYSKNELYNLALGK